MVIHLENPFKNIRWCDLFFAFYFCVLLGNQQDEGFDAQILRMAFFLLAGYLFFIEVLKKNRLTELTGSKGFIWICGLTAYSLISSLWAIKSAYSLNLIPQFGQCVIAAITVILCYQGEDNIRRALNIIIIASLYCLIVVYIRTPEAIFGIKRLGSAAGINANSFGCTMAIAFCISMFNVSKTQRKWMWVFLCIAFGFFALNSGSKKAFIILILGAILLALFSSKAGIKKIGAVIFAGIVVYLVYYFCMYYPPLYEIIGVRIETFLEQIFYDSGSSSGSTAIRLMLISEAQQIFKSNPVVGIGLNNFVVAVSNSSFVAYAHNNYWEILSTLGIIGFAINYSIYVLIMKNIVIAQKSSKSDYSSLFLTLILIRLFIDYAMVTFYKPYYVILLVLTFSFGHGALKGEDTINEQTT